LKKALERSIKSQNGDPHPRKDGVEGSLGLVARHFLNKHTIKEVPKKTVFNEHDTVETVE
jgi:hypothetical protein